MNHARASRSTRSLLACLALIGTALACDPDTGPPDEKPADKLLTVAVQKDGDGLGDVVSAPDGIECMSDCTEQEHDFVIGGEVTLDATAARNALFAGWSCDAGAGAPRTSAEEVIVATTPDDEEGARVTCTATFRKLTTIVFVFPGSAEGRVTGTLTKSDGTPRLDCRSDDGVVCDAGYFAGEMDTFTAVADEGATFVRWGFDCGSGTDPVTLTMDEDKDCEAVFE